MGELYVIEAIQMAQFSWILRMDADEFLSDDLRNNIRNLIKNDSIDAYTFIWKIWNGKKYISEKFPFKKSFVERKIAIYRVSRDGIGNERGYKIDRICP